MSWRAIFSQSSRIYIFLHFLACFPRSNKGIIQLHFLEMFLSYSLPLKSSSLYGYLFSKVHKPSYNPCNVWHIIKMCGSVTMKQIQSGVIASCLLNESVSVDKTQSQSRIQNTGQLANVQTAKAYTYMYMYACIYVQ